MGGLNSLFGLPWLVAATVRSINHVKGFAIHTLIAASILCLRPVLRQVPFAALMGLFLYLGTSALAGNGMWERTKGLFEDPSRSAPRPWTEQGKTTVARSKVVLY